ncbi:phage tail tape measure protein [Timonella senegalensis]|uniref:phage tail tape measure protein n=1 Tax=Timonella senegalensis TaxID=1465825 RepID=UPI0028B1B569|nr:phage tail tape measure protein [Timonella senegalensis]
MSLSVGKLHALLTVQDEMTPGLKKAEKAVKDLAQTTSTELAKTETATSKTAKSMDKVGDTAATAGKKSKTGLDSAAKGAESLDKGLGKVKTSGKAAGDSVSGGAKKSQTSIAGAEKQATGFAAALKKIDANSASINDLANEAGKVGLALAAASVAAVGVAANFDKGMSAVKATGADAAQNIGALREAAIDAGADTAYSATEAAGAIEELSKAGVSASDVLGGALAGSLDLAAAGEIGVADAAGIASIAMTQFKLSGTDVGHVADLLAAGAGKAMGGVQELGEGLKQGGLVASAMGMSLEETVAALSSFASAGLLGSDAGTSMKTMLQSLQNPSSKAKKLMDELGISLYDAQGNFAGLTNLAGQLEKGMGNMTQAQRDAAMATIFGSDAVRAANVIFDEGADGIENWIAQVDDAGYAAITAATMMDNLVGDVENLGGAFESVLIESGSGANDVLRYMTQTATGLVNAVGGLPGPVLQAGLGITAVAAAALLGTAGFAKLAVKGVEVNKAFTDLGMKAPVTAKGIKAVSKVASAATIALVALGAAASFEGRESSQGLEEIKAGLLDIADGASAADTAFKNVEGNWFDGPKESLEDLLAYLGDDAVLSRFDKFANDAAAGIAGIFGIDFRNTAQEQRDELEAYGDALGALANSDLPAATRAFQQLNTETDGTEEQTRFLIDSMPGFKDALYGIAKSSGLATDDVSLMNLALGNTKVPAKTAEEAALALADAQTEAAAQVSEATQKWLDGIHAIADESTNLLSAFDMVVAANMEQATSAAEASASTKDSWEDFYDGTSVKASDWIAQLEEQVSAYENWGDNLVSVQERLTKLLPENMQEAGVALVEELQNAGPESAAAVQALVDGSDEELERIVGLSQQRGEEAADAYADAINNARPPAFQLDIGPAAERSAELTAILNGADENISAWKISADGTMAVNEAEDTIVTIDEKTGEITILGDNTDALEAAARAKATADGTKAEINIDADTDSAQRALAAFRAKVNTMLSIPITARVGVQQARATGGPIFGPGTGTSDEIPAWLSNGEHVLTAQEVQAMGGHGSVERWRRAALAGNLPAFAYGGAVTDAEKSLNSINAKITKQKKVVSKEKGDVKAAQKTYDGIDGKKANAGAKKKAKANLEAQKKQLKKEEKELDELRDERDDIKDQLKRLKDDSREASRDARRGNIRDSVTGGLNSAYGIVDELWDQSRNTDLSKKKREAAGKAAQQLEADLVKAYAQADALATKMESAKDDLAELANIRAGVKSILGGEFTLSDSIKAATEATTVLVQKTNEAGDSWYQVEEKAATSANFIATDALANITGKVSRVKEFTGKINKLAALGISGVLLAEIGKEGIEGGILMADALLADPVTAKALSGAYADLDAATSAAGAAVTQNSTVNGQFYAGGVTQAETAVKDIQKSIDAVNATIADLAKGAETAILSALGLKKDKNGKVVAKADGGPVVGPGTGTSDSIPALLSNGEHIITAAEVQAAGGHGAVEKWRSAMKAGRLNENRLPTVQSLPPVATQIVVNQTPAGMTRAEMEAAIEAGITRGVAAIAAAAERGTASGSYKALTGAASDITTLTRMGGN